MTGASRGIGQSVANHERVWGRHRTISAAEHATAARVLRAERVALRFGHTVGG